MNIYHLLFQHKGLSLERLQSFCLVAEKGGFNKAAGENIYKQSQYSRQIADLEKFFGASLFIRKGKTIELSPQGQELHSVCKDFFSSLHALKSTASTRKENLIISAGQSVIDFLMPQAFDDQLIKDLKSATFISRNSEEAVEDVLNYNSHCAFVSRVIRDKDIASILILSSPIVIVYANNNKKNLYVGNDIAQLSRNPLAIMQGQGDLRNSILKLFGRNKPNIIFEAPTFLALKRFAATGKAMAFIPRYTLSPEDKETLKESPLPTKSALNRSIYLIWRKNLANQNKPLMKIIRQLADSVRSSQ